MFGKLTFAFFATFTKSQILNAQKYFVLFSSRNFKIASNYC